MLFWVNCIMSNSNGKPWYCSCSDGQLTFDDAIKVVKKYEENYKDELICAWIESYPSGERTEDRLKVVYWIKCYVDVFGNNELKEEKNGNT